MTCPRIWVGWISCWRTADTVANATSNSPGKPVSSLIALGRDSHHRPWRERFEEPPPLKSGARPVESMAHRLKTREGRDLYALRKQTVEPVFGIIKSVMEFRQLLLRGLDRAGGEWSLVTLSWNIKRMFALQPA